MCFAKILLTSDASLADLFGEVFLLLGGDLDLAISSFLGEPNSSKVVLNFLTIWFLITSSIAN